MVQSDPIVTVAPLMFLVVLKIADVSREIELEEIYGKHSWQIHGPFFSKLELGHFGRFPYLHSLSFVILYMVFIGAAYSYSGSLVQVLTKFQGDVTIVLLSGVTLMLWLTLPILEVNEYSTVTATTELNIPRSFATHVNNVIMVSVLSMLISWLLPKVWSGNPKEWTILAYALALLAAVVLNLFFITRAIEKYFQQLDKEFSSR